MINLQNPEIPTDLQPIEIDAAIQDLQAKLDTNLVWLTNSYGRCYRHFERKNDKLVYVPEVYAGKVKGKYKYHPMNPDSDKKGSCFFIVSKEDNRFYRAESNYLNYEVGIVFWCNLKKINDELLKTEYFLQHLINDVRKVLTHSSSWYDLKIKNTVTDFNDIYKEFNLNESENYLRAPYGGFRFNCEIQLREHCDSGIDRENAIVQNISENEILQLLLPQLDFSIDEVFNSLSENQKQQITQKLNDGN
jgi:hypothetical protein